MKRGALTDRRFAGRGHLLLLDVVQLELPLLLLGQSGESQVYDFVIFRGHKFTRFHGLCRSRPFLDPLRRGVIVANLFGVKRLRERAAPGTSQGKRSVGFIGDGGCGG